MAIDPDSAHCRLAKRWIAIRAEKRAKIREIVFA
jgi:hypothetical protein